MSSLLQCDISQPTGSVDVDDTSNGQAAIGGQQLLMQHLTPHRELGLLDCPVQRPHKHVYTQPHTPKLAQSRHRRMQLADQDTAVPASIINLRLYPDSQKATDNIILRPHPARAVLERQQLSHKTTAGCG